MKNDRLFLMFVVLVLASLACSLFGGGTSGTEGNAPSVDSEPQKGAPATKSSGKFETEFPLPQKVENFIDMGNGVINYQTPMSLTDVVDFYRGEFERAGYNERDILTSIEEIGFSFVWDGHPSGKIIVVQGVDLGDGTVNVNVRLEDE